MPSRLQRLFQPVRQPARQAVRRTVFGAILSCLLFAGMLAGLAGCGGETTVDMTQGEPVEVPVDGFVLVAADASTYDGRASILLTFSVPLAGAQAFDTLLAVRDGEGAIPSGSWVLENDGRELRFPYLESNRSYEVTLKAALAATDGTTIGKDQVRSVHTGPLEPVLGFASQGSVLPAHESRGLPVVTVNVSAVDVEFLRVRDKHLNTFLGEFSSGGRRSYWSLDQMAKYADPVYTNRFAIDGVPNERTLSYLPIRDIDELAAPGLYFAVMKRSGAFGYEQDTSLFLVSDIGLHVRHYPTGLLVHAASLESGEPKSGVRVVVRDARGAVLARGESDREGMVRLEDYRLQSEHLLLAQKGDDVAMLPFNQAALDLSEFVVSGRPQRPVEIFPWASRDIFRPGETITVSALLRDHDGAATAAQPVFATLRQPDGKPVRQQQLVAQAQGYHEFSHTLPVDSATGRWSVDFATDPESSDQAHGFSFRVEEFLPERLKLDLTSTATALRAGAELPLQVDAAYLHGSPAAGNRFTARLVQLADPHPVADLPDFFFGDVAVELPAAVDDFIDVRLDAAGRLQQAVTVAGEAATATPVQLVIAGSVHETGGRAVTRSLKRTVWPAGELVGVRPLFDIKDGANPDADASFEVIRTNAAGELLAADGLQVKVIREVRDYQWRFVDNVGWTFDFTTRDETVLTTELAIAAGARGRVQVPVTWGGYRLEITDPSTKLVLRQPFEAGWSSSESRGVEARPDKVKLVFDKPAYAAGETMGLTLTAPHEGPALLLVEGDGLLWHKTLEVGQGTRVEIPLDAEWNRHDLYVTALVFRPGSSADGITPNRAVGVAHVPLDRGDRTVEVTLKAPKTMRPLAPLVIDVAAPALAGQQASIRLSATDAGVLNMTSFPMPDAAAWFFAPRRLGVDSYDLYSRVIESFAGEQARLRFGGDAAVLSLPQGRRPNAEIRIVDLQATPVQLDAQGNARVEVAVPDFNGTLRIRALVYADNRFGASEHDTLVRAPVILEASLPRVLAPGDNSQLTLDLENASGRDGEFHLQLAADGPLTITEPSRKVMLAEGARTTLTIPVQAREGFGVARVNAELSGAGIALSRHFEVAVRPAWPAVSRLTASTVPAGTTIVADRDLRSGLYPESVVQRISVGRLPALPFVQSVQGLLQYPYGCAEQTTSRAMPLVMLDDDTRGRLGIDEALLLDRDQRRIDVSGPARAVALEQAFARLASMQNASGHFSLWPGEPAGNSVITPYVVELLLLARDAGFAIPAAMLDKALNTLLEDVLKGGNTHYAFEHFEHMRLAELAHAGYVLARAGKAPLGTLRAVFDNERGKLMAALPLAHLGAALALAGDKTRAVAAFNEAATRDWQRPEWLGDYGSRLRDQVLVAALAREQGLATPATDALAEGAARELLGEQGATSDQWLSTQEQIAILRLGKALVSGSDGVFDLEVSRGGVTETLAGRRLVTQPVDDAGGAGDLRMVSRSAGSLFVVQTLAGIPREPVPASRDDISIERKWYRPDGSLFTGNSIREGDVLVAAITLKSKRRMADALVTDLVPGGLELENLNLTDPAQWNGIEIDGIDMASQIDAGTARFEEYRDDRFAAAIDVYDGAEVRLFYLLRAVTPGNYVVPPVGVEDMYRPAMRVTGSRTLDRLVVTPP